ncbi:hypothetical protein ACFXMT_38665 [Streptomyces mirabilis]|uniref:hypothetical protein n=1 Tax=Streptomyces mirabilis TaxID=68239 RepID=UPI0036C67148
MNLADDTRTARATDPRPLLQDANPGHLTPDAGPLPTPPSRDCTINGARRCTARLDSSSHQPTSTCCSGRPGLS